ncbi:MAG: NfeD family protein [Succinivibrio sp.]|nr:NfeD family protein [Succinivibrio sp.]
MSATAIWLTISLLVLGAEMLLGTIYLLAVFLGAVTAAIFSLMDFSVTVQCYAAGLVVFLGSVAAYVFRRHIRKLNAVRDLHSNDLDRGQKVKVTTVLEDGTAKVSYRGTLWTAQAKEGSLHEGVFVIDHVAGPRLVLREIDS